MWWERLVPSDVHVRAALGLVLAVAVVSLAAQALAPSTPSSGDYDAAYKRRVRDLAQLSLNSAQLSSQDTDGLTKLEHLVEAQTFFVAAGQLVSSDALASIAGLDDAQAFLDRVRRRRAKTVEGLRKRCAPLAAPPREAA